MSAPALEKRLERFARAAEGIRRELAKAVVGQEDVVEQLLIALFARGHCLLVGVPGLAKTLLVSSLASILDLQFKRIQFTPDLMPSDITGTDILQEDAGTRQRAFTFAPGPLFANLVLADEINRTPPKTQSALLQAMQEHRVTVLGRTYPLPDPFFVLATQNPIEQEGTYPLPEAQLDRFLFQVNMGYPSAEEESDVLRRTTGGAGESPAKTVNAADLLEFQSLVREVPVADTPLASVVRLVRSTRPDDPKAPEVVKSYVTWGAGPRAGQALILGAKVRCLLRGRLTVSWEDVAALAAPVLRHRLLLSYRAEAEGVRVDDVVRRLLDGAGGG
ncbi:MAG TPA: MoxR family ATPase [Elusimicrobiota bacterium]|nr:MoxR family ATPase [Elusimicrobiota bacterium]